MPSNQEVMIPVNLPQVLFAPVLGHRYLPVYDGLRLQDILVVAVGQGLMIALHVVMRRPVALAGGPFDLGEDGGFVEQSQVPLKVEHSSSLVLVGPPFLTLFFFCAACVAPLLLDEPAGAGDITMDANWQRLCLIVRPYSGVMSGSSPGMARKFSFWTMIARKR
ncbi:hypothetical protein EYF80_025720 [Liparis tanakae]|uniref:Uncharacterized protein n=1 Tax=Liparis tanakae TaxID=230148 RepID=A0A4Z2HDQ0_9TELE|nr:hypothetical protein EYF80_025720 [Liparis tanakae]